MSRSFRFPIVGLFVCVLTAPLCVADECEAGKCAKKSADCPTECCAATTFKNPADVHWVHKRVSFGNYMKMAAVEAPAPPPAPVTFGPVFFDFKKTHMRPESVEACYQLIEFMKAHPTQTVLIDGSNAKMGARRADIVKSFLMENGIDAGRILITTDGSQPAADIKVRVGESPR